MARKHENFGWGGYKYAPESFGFSCNGKHINFSEEKRSELALLAACGQKEKLIIELKRALREEEKKPRIVYKSICFFKKDSNEYYYTLQLLYKPDDLQGALRCYKEWKRYIQSKKCILETGYEVTSGDFNPFGKSNTERKVVTNVVDLTKCRTVNIVRKPIFA